ncbi:hypothetical protein A0J61_05290 [Choanephora cucurbitarum]|uniref:Zn(2)-C6 fungal-type domain-containing protein n=1 Tax=Choanephora cucurbitarum TaxID=101091 RepID=A0A1C7NDM6_9FUNG|nr:hypothetical protein A0J61_05290 [Choanephora cucurbitarum]
MQAQFDLTPTKKSPCNGCREKKRKCSYEQPCARCSKNGTECIYITMPSPKDLEYIQELEYINQIDQLEQQITSMESEISILKLANEKTCADHYPSPTSYSYDSSDEDKSISSKQSLSYPDEDNTLCLPIVRTKHIQAAVSKSDENPAKPWRLTVQNGNMTIETNIKSHSELMACVSSMFTTAVHQQQTNTIPFPFNICPSFHKDATAHAMSIIVWRKYGKSKLKSVTKYTPDLLFNIPPKEITHVIPHNQLNSILRSLIEAYFSCMHFHHFCLYRAGFLEMFMTDMHSPAIFALCSVICHLDCKHLDSIILSESRPQYALFFFEQARELIEDRFDESSIETLITYTYLSLYKIKTNAVTEASFYLSHAMRIRDLLMPQFGWTKQETRSIEVYMLDRLNNCLNHLQSVLEVQNIWAHNFKDKRMPPMRFFELIDSYDIGPSRIMPGDSPLERQALRLYHHLAQLRENIKRAISNIEGDDLPTYISLFGHHIEMTMRHWYRQLLPKEYQLSLPLFDSLPDLEFFTVLELECGQSPFPLISLLSLYNEYLIMAKSYMPKIPIDKTLDTEQLISKLKDVIYPNSPHQTSEKTMLDTKQYEWLKHFFRKLDHFRQHHQDFFSDNELEESREDFMIRIVRSLKLPQINFSMPLMHTAVRVALDSVRLIQFFLTRHFSCPLDLRWVMNAWDVLLRAARFRYQQPNDPSVTLDRIRANLLLCLDVIQSTVERRDPSHEFINHLQAQFYQSFL